MWPNYKTEEAVASLNSYIAKVSQETVGGVPLGNLEIGDFTVTEVANSRALKVVSSSDHSEELVVKAVGIVCALNTPPFRRPLQTNDPRHVKKLRQHVKISGGGSLLFDEYERKVNTVIDLFSTEVGREHLQVPDPGLFDDHYALDFHTRYFEERRFADGVSHVPFDPSVDPQGILEAARGTNFVHGEQNIVEYCVKTYDEEGHPRYETLPPGDIAVGDIVEVQATFTVFPFRTDENPNIRYRLVYGMRALILLTHEFAKQMRDANSNKHMRIKQQRRMGKASPKRKFLTGQLANEGKMIESEAEQNMDTM